MGPQEIADADTFASVHMLGLRLAFLGCHLSLYASGDRIDDARPLACGQNVGAELQDFHQHRQYHRRAHHSHNPHPHSLLFCAHVLALDVEDVKHALQSLPTVQYSLQRHKSGASINLPRSGVRFPKPSFRLGPSS